MANIHPALDSIIDVHTHLSGSDSGESPQGIVKTLDESGVDKAFIFAPLLDVKSWQLTDTDIDHVRVHNDYCADLCSYFPDRLIGFCVLNPAPALAGGDLSQAVSLMVDEVSRCYHELGLRGVKMVPAGWYPNDPELLPLYRRITGLGMYTVFHVGIFLDAKEGSYCRPTFYEQVHQVLGMRVQLAHLGWPWVDETLAVLAQEQMTSPDEALWQMRADVSFGPPDDWQLNSWEKAMGSVPAQRLLYGSDGFWPMDTDQYLESYLLPQLGLFEIASTNTHIAEEGSPERRHLRQLIFAENARTHWSAAVREPQKPRRADRTLSTPSAMAGHA